MTAKHPTTYNVLRGTASVLRGYEMVTSVLALTFIPSLALLPLAVAVGYLSPTTADPFQLAPLHDVWSTVGDFALRHWIATIVLACFFSQIPALFGIGALTMGLAMIFNGHGQDAGPLMRLGGAAAIVFFPAGYVYSHVLKVFPAVSAFVERHLVLAQEGKQPDMRERQLQAEPAAPTPRNQGAGQAPQYPAKRPTLRFSDLHGMATVKAKLLEAGRAARAIGPKATNGILLYGKPGNGKTILAEALSGELNLPFLSVSIADIASRWVGQTTEQLVEVFKSAEAQAPCVLLIDEIDSVISDRSGSSSSSEEGQRTTNAFLTEVVRLRGKGVVVMAATNFLDRLDAAATREGRFDHKIEITPPDQEARVGLLRDGIRAEAPRVAIADEEIAVVAKRWSGFSVARLRAVAREAGKSAVQGRHAQLGRNDLLAALRRVQATRTTLPEGVKRLDELSMAPDQADVLHGVAWRMKSLFEAEAAGASVPDGVLFYGPPGTGKTAAVRALAEETGWALFITSGNDLVNDPRKMDAIHAQAEDARPAIVFIDEADDLLADRQYSATRSATNRLLTVMDGAHGKTPDVLYIAATNHPGQLDPAVMRGGRFTEKVGFDVPEAAALRAVVANWLATKGWRADGGVDAVTARLHGLSVPDALATLQAAVNLRVNRAIRAKQPIDKTIDADTLEIALAMTVPNLG